MRILPGIVTSNDAHRTVVFGLKEPILSQENVGELCADLARAVSDRVEPSRGAWVNGRIVAVLGTPTDGSTSDMAYGLSTLLPGTETPEHSHRAEELALIVSGSGEIQIDDEVRRVSPGDLVRTAPNARHLTRSGPNGPLQVLWVYAPAGSEQRWLADEPEEN
jgi:quercetin dioxygenase-like cupin family protein